MDNVRPNASRSTQGFLADSGLQIIKQSHYMLDFNLSDGFLFRKMEYGLNGVDLMDQDGVRKSVLHIFRHISEDFLVRHLWKLRYHAKRVIENEGHLLPE